MSLDLNLRKSILEFFVLALLHLGPSYGYKIVLDLNQYFEISESTLYPILRRLKEHLKVTVTPDVYHGRVRKYYEITALGQQVLADFQREWETIQQFSLILGNQHQGE
jgi:PadR family transcriptional regulator PadR